MADNNLKVLLAKALSFMFFITGLLFILPLYIVEPLMWLWFIYLGVNFKQSDWSIDRTKLPLLFLICFYLIELLSLTYSSNVIFGVKALNSYLPVLLLSLLMIGTPIAKVPVVKTVKALVISLYIGIFSSLIFVAYSFVFNNSFSSILNIDPESAFSEVLLHWMHRSYLAFALAIGLVYFYIVIDGRTKLVYWWLTYLSVVLFIWYSGARMPLIYIILLGFGIGVDCLLKYRGLVKVLLASTVILLITSVILLYNHSGFAVFKNMLSASPDQLVKLDSRFQIWSIAVSVIEKNVIFGVGIGDVKELLMQKYAINNFKLGELLSYNSHNQFLHIWLESGILGLLFFCLSLISTLFVFKNINFSIRLLYVVIVFCAFFVENILQRAAGRELFMFSFIMLFALNAVEKPKITIPDYWFKGASIVSLFCVIILTAFPYSRVFKVDFKKPETFANGKFRIIQYEEFPKAIPNDIPIDTKGLLLDTFAFRSITTDAPYISNVFSKSITNFGDKVEARVLTFVSEEFNGGAVFLFSRNQLLKYNIDTCINRGAWQYLNIEHLCINGELVIGLYVEPKEFQLPTELEGYVIFAYPQYNFLKPNN